MTRKFLISSSIASLALFMFVNSPARAWDTDSQGSQGSRRGGTDSDYNRGGRRGDDDYNRGSRRGDDDYDRRPPRRHDDDDYDRRRGGGPYFPPGHRGPVIIIPSYGDRDHDGIPDYRDTYDDRYPGRGPNTRPLPRYPDRDHDGIPDYRDSHDNRMDKGDYVPSDRNPRRPPRETSDRYPNDQRGTGTDGRRPPKTTEQDNTPGWNEQEKKKSESSGPSQKTSGNTDSQGRPWEGSDEQKQRCKSYGAGDMAHPCP